MIKITRLREAVPLDRPHATRREPHTLAVYLFGQVVELTSRVTLTALARVERPERGAPVGEIPSPEIERDRPSWAI